MSRGVLVVQKKCFFVNFDFPAFISNFPQGAYTACRSNEGGRKIFLFQRHMKRLVDSTFSMIKQNVNCQLDTSCNSERSNKEIFYDKIYMDAIESAKLAINFINENEKQKKIIFEDCQEQKNNDANIKERKKEYQIVYLIPFFENQNNLFFKQNNMLQCNPFDLVTYVFDLPYHSPTVQVEVRNGKRCNPNIKDSTWPKVDRKLYDELRYENSNEVILSNINGDLSEGISSNFFVIYSDNSVITAPDNFVLSGTIRAEVLNVCSENHIRTVKEFPNIKDVNKWNGCFITSTSRLVKPVHKIILVDEKREVIFQLHENDLVFKIQQLVFDKLSEMSLDVF